MKVQLAKLNKFWCPDLATCIFFWGRFLSSLFLITRENTIVTEHVAASRQLAIWENHLFTTRKKFGFIVLNQLGFRPLGFSLSCGVMKLISYIDVSNSSCRNCLTTSRREKYTSFSRFLRFTCKQRLFQSEQKVNKQVKCFLQQIYKVKFNKINKYWKFNKLPSL